MRFLRSLLLCIAAVSAGRLAAQTAADKRSHQWWNDRPVGERPYTANARKMALISVKGNHFIDPEGKTVLFRGLSISDPDKLQGQGHWSKEHFAKVKEMGAMVVRIPVHPVAWRDRTPAEYLKLLDQAVEWCTDLNL
ncbi:MAG: glycoside hydrolase family 5 protein, partial [Bryobacteraceae bacterium]